MPLGNRRPLGFLSLCLAHEAPLGFSRRLLHCGS